MFVWTYQKFESWLLVLLCLFLLQFVFQEGRWKDTLSELFFFLFYFLCPALYHAGCHKIAAFVFLTSFRESLTVWSMVIFAFAFSQRYVSAETAARCPLVETRASSHKIAPIADSKTQSLC